MRPHRTITLLVVPLLLVFGGCVGESDASTPALVLLDSLAGLDDGLVTGPVYIGPDLVVGAGMSPLAPVERHWIIRRDDEGRWAVTDEYEHRPAGVRFALEDRRHGNENGRPTAARGVPDRSGDPESQGTEIEPASAVLGILDGWGTVRPRLALVGGYWEPIPSLDRFQLLAETNTGKRYFRSETGGPRQWVFLAADSARVRPEPVVTGAAATFAPSASDSSGGWGLLSDQVAFDVPLDAPRVRGILAPAGISMTPATALTEQDELHRTLLDTLSAQIEGWSGATPFRPAGMHRLPGPGGADWVFVRAARPGSRACEGEVMEVWIRADRPDRLHQMIRGETQCSGPGWPTSLPLGLLRTAERHFAVSLEGSGPDATIGITELFESSVGSRRGGATRLAVDARGGAQPTPADGAADSWTDWPIVLSYVQPQALNGVPEEIRQALQADACLIPTLRWGRQNVVRGRFASPDQEDWAVLCSRDGVSEIRIFWGGEARCPQPIAPSPDRQWLQDRGDSTAVLGRTVGRYSPREVSEWLEYYELEPGIDFTHDVLLDTHEGRPVTGFRYCSGGVWITEG